MKDTVYTYLPHIFCSLQYVHDGVTSVTNYSQARPVYSVKFGKLNNAGRYVAGKSLGMKLCLDTFVLCSSWAFTDCAERVWMYPTPRPSKLLVFLCKI